MGQEHEKDDTIFRKLSQADVKALVIISQCAPIPIEKNQGCTEGEPNKCFIY